MAAFAYLDELIARWYPWAKALSYAPGCFLVGAGLGAYLRDGWLRALVYIGRPGLGYLVFSYTLIIFGGFSMFLVWRYGPRGLPLSAIAALGCDIAMTLANSQAAQDLVIWFTWNHSMAPVAYFVVLVVCWGYCRPLKINILNYAVLGMLVVWVLAFSNLNRLDVHYYYYFEPTLELSWIVGFYSAVRPERVAP